MNISCLYFLFVRKSETQKRSEEKGMRTQICLLSAHFHDVLFYQNS